MKKIIAIVLFLNLIIFAPICFASTNASVKSLQIYTNELIDTLSNKKNTNSAMYNEYDTVLRNYLKDETGIVNLSNDFDKIVVIIGNLDDFNKELQKNELNLQTFKSAILGMKNWTIEERLLLLDDIKNNMDKEKIKSDLDKVINKNINGIQEQKTEINKPVNNDDDVSDIGNHWAKSYIEFMIKNKIAAGYADDTFKPDNKISRAEFAKMLVETLKLNKVVYNGTFSDIKNHWAKDYIQTAYNAGIITGYSDQFKPDSNITRAELATMIGRTIGEEVTAKLDIFKDETKIKPWAKDGVGKSLYKKYIEGSKGYFRPNDNTTRAEAITVLYKIAISK